jgi:hypothetical protein
MSTALKTILEYVVFTRADHKLEQKLRSYVVRDPEVRHLIFAHSMEE